ncbi:MAG: alpha/beta hydrolase [Gordonia sp. (in: high G+C Gram-positive bacteria)]
MHRRWRRPAAILLTALVVGVSGCAVGPDTGPGLVPGGAYGGDAPATSSSRVPAPALRPPTDNLSWHECGSRLADDYHAPAPDGVTVECATFPSPIDPDRNDGALEIGLTRARLAATPADAAPLILTSGTDMPSSRALLLLTAGAGRSLLATHPVVAIDRRGLGLSSPLDCLTRADRATLTNNAAAGGGGQNARISRLAQSASSAADSCTETLTPDQLAFTVRGAAIDLEALRAAWKLDRLGLIGVGEGSDVVLAYTALYAGRAGRIILDTPTPYGANARDAGAAQAAGVQAALTLFARRCATLGNCPLASGGVATMTAVLTKARAGDLDGLSDAETLTAITTALAVAPSSPDGITDVAAAIAAADHGNTEALRRLADAAAELRGTDGQLVGTCSDVTGPIGQNDVGRLVGAWSRQFPLTGAVTALSLLRCNGWSAGEAVNPPAAFPVAPLVLSNTGDPLHGASGTATLGSLFARASTTPVTVGWAGLGFSMLARSGCAADLVAEYVDRGRLAGPTERGCPA